MKIMKKALALVLSLVMMLAMGVTVFAAGETYTITVKGDSGHTYEAYQVFAGALSENETTLSNVTWGAGVNGSTLLTALKADATIGSKFTEIKADDKYAAEKVAEIVATFTNDSTDAQAFAKVVGANLSSTVAGTSTEAKNADGKTSVYTISGLAAGYYLVKDKNDTAPSDDAYTRYILRVVDDVEVDAKVSVPQLDKTITGATAANGKANTASVGDSVPYTLTTKVPDMTGYTKYYFIVNDKMSKGLTFNNDVEIKIDGTALTKDTDYTVSSSTDAATGVTTVKIVFKDFVKKQALSGKDVVITYSATVNQDAVITDAGNPNTATLTYSNNPNIEPKSKTDEPGEDDKGITGETPETKTITYVTAVKLTKVDAKDRTKTLTGAKFKISGDKVNVTVINSEVYEKATDGTYYMLKNGTYTTEAPTADSTGDDGTVHKGNADQYDSTTQMYKKVEAVTKTTSKEAVNAEGYVLSDGTITFKGLGIGEYEITELVAPDGYNLLKSPVKIVITGDPKMDGANWTVTGDGTALSAEAGVYQMTVVNNSGSVLPTTGGMGTTIFYVVGAILVLGAAVVLITRRRMSK